MAQSVHASNYRTRAENNSGYAHRVAEAQGEEELMCVTALVQPFHAFKTVTSLYLRVETYDLMASLLLMVFAQKHWAALMTSRRVAQLTRGLHQNVC